VTYAELAAIERDEKAWDTALRWCGQGIDLLELVLALEPNHSEARKVLSNTHMARGETLARLGRRDRALDDWKQMAELGKGQNHADLLGMRALGLAQLGYHRQATAEVRALEALGREPAYSIYNYACVFALSMREVGNDPTLTAAHKEELADRYGREAYDRMVKMRNVGFFRSPGMVKALTEDTDMKSLEARADYRKLVEDLEREARPPGK
jgi:tetratricopeptide (TPR) repeat protein